MIQENPGPSFGSPPSRFRFIIFATLFALSALAVLGRYVFLMTSGSSGVAGLTALNTGERGPIVDRNGHILAIQTQLGNITLWRPEVQDLQATAEELGPLVGIDVPTLKQRIEESKTDFIYIKKKVDQSVIRAIEQEKAQGRLSAVHVEAESGRVYPEKQLASPLIGFVGEDNQGLAGIEYAFNQELSPSNGKAYGNQVVLTIDTGLQNILEGIAEKSLQDNVAEAVMFLAMDPRNGDILGYVSLPDFDPNDIQNSDEISRMDRPAIWAYEPGSVFKIFTLSTFLDSGAIQDTSSFYCDGKYEHTTNLGEKVTIKCLSSHGTVHPREIITYSCNAGAAYASDKIDAASFYDRLINFGFGSRTGIGIPGETAGFLRPVDRWSARSKPTIAIGQEIAVSALQMMQAATVVANNGVLVQPRIVLKVLASDGSVVKTPETAGARRVISAETAQLMRSYMTSVTTNLGTGHRAKIDDLSLAVKTGTAQLIDRRTGAYSDTDYIASCMAMVPADNPVLVLYHVIVKPKGPSYLGGQIAAPPIRDAAEALTDYLGIPRGRNPQAVHSGTIVVPTDKSADIKDVMPDLRGYSKKQLLPLLLREDITVDIQGDGWVKNQDPAPGSPITPGTTIHLDLQ